jgi:hypothetical protein
MERAGLRPRPRPPVDELPRFRIILPRNVQSEVLGPVLPLRNTSTLHGDAGAAYAQSHNEPLHLYTNSFLPNVETHFATSWPAQLAPGLGAQADQCDPFQSIPNTGIDPFTLSYEGMMQPPFSKTSHASLQDPWTGSLFAHGRESPSTANAYGEFSSSQARPNFISILIGAPLQSEQFWANSSVLADSRREAFGQVNSSFPEQTMPYKSTHPRIDVNLTEDFLDFSGSQNVENWQSFRSETVEAAPGLTLDNRSAVDDFDDFSMFVDTSQRLDPTLAAFMLGIPEDPGEATRNKELPFGYETSSPNHGV